MTPANPAQSGTASRFRQRLFHPWTHFGDASVTGLTSTKPKPLPKRQLGFQARIAEFLLIHRLRARRPHSPDVLARAEQIVSVTWQNWFAPPERRERRPHRQL